MTDLTLFSNISEVKRKAKQYLGKDTVVKPSTRKDKKFMVLNPKTNKYSHFGQIGYEDFTKHKDIERRNNYLNRATKIKGNWKKDKYSPNNLSIHILW